VFSRIVVANDGSEGGFKALAMGCEFAKRDGAALHMISVEELPDFPASIDEIIEIKDTETTNIRACSNARTGSPKQATSISMSRS
jgi:nucleotide-binding universal stress UspA family protein